MHQNTAATPEIPQDSMLVLLVKLIDRIPTRPILSSFDSASVSRMYGPRLPASGLLHLA